MTTQRCSSTACVPCDKREEGCFVRKTKDGYKLVAATGSDLHYSSITITLKCVAGEYITMYAYLFGVHNGKMTIYFNGKAVYSHLG